MITIFSLVDKKFLQQLLLVALVLVIIFYLNAIFVYTTTTVLVILVGILFATVMTRFIAYVSSRMQVSWWLGFTIAWLVVVVLPFLIISFVTYFINPAEPISIASFREEISNVTVPESIPGAQFIEEKLTSLTSKAGMDQFLFSGQLGGVVVSFVTVVTYVVAILFIALQGSFQPCVYSYGFLQLFTPSSRVAVQSYLSASADALSWWILARLISMAAVAVLTYVGLLLIGLPYALLLAIIAGLLSFVPNIGTLVAIVPAVLLATQDSTWMILMVLVVYVVVQTIEGYLVTPYFQERLVSTPAALLISVQLLLGVLFGIIGVFIAGPLLALVISLFSHTQSMQLALTKSASPTNSLSPHE